MPIAVSPSLFSLSLSCRSGFGETSFSLDSTPDCSRATKKRTRLALGKNAHWPTAYAIPKRLLASLLEKDSSSWNLALCAD